MRALFTQSKSDTRGTAALEFAIIAPVFLAMAIGGIYMCMMAFAMGSMQEAVQAAARCYSVQATVCTNASTTQSYASTHYYGPAFTPTFVASTPSCGHKVTGTITYSFPFYYNTLSVPLSASACFP